MKLHVWYITLVYHRNLESQRMFGADITVRRNCYILIHYVQPNVNCFQPMLIFMTIKLYDNVWMVARAIQAVFQFYLRYFPYTPTLYTILFNPKLFEIPKRSATSSKIYISFALLVLQRPWIFSDLSSLYYVALQLSLRLLMKCVIQIAAVVSGPLKTILEYLSTSKIRQLVFA